MFEGVRADIARCQRPGEVLLNPAMWAVLVYRFNRWSHGPAVPFILRLPVRIVAAALDVATRMVLHIELPAQAEIGPGLYIPHTGCVVVGTSVRIGRHCTLAHGVTIGHGGGGELKRDGAPAIGDRVYVGPGAIIIGPIEIGDDALIGAGAVVVRSVPPAGVVAGNPGRLLSRHGSFDLIRYPRMEGDAARNAALAAFRPAGAAASGAG